MRRKTSGERTETTAFFIFSAKKIFAGLPGEDRSLIRYVWKQCHEARVFNGLFHRSLVFGTGPGHAPRRYLSVRRDKFFQQFHIFVINSLILVFAENTYLFSRSYFFKSHFYTLSISLSRNIVCLKRQIIVRNVDRRHVFIFRMSRFDR